MNTIAERLAAAFDHSEVKLKPQVVQGRRALAISYVNSRAIMDRLDAVLGICGWEDSYDVLPDGSVVCHLRLKIDGEWIAKTDVGAPSEQPDGGDRMKAAFSDALKRAAIKFGIGRYLYRLEPEWRDWDPAKKTFTERHIITRKDLAGATEAQLTILDDLLARVNKDKSWLVAAIQTKFSRNCPADLSIMEADQVIKGLEKMAAAA